MIAALEAEADTLRHADAAAGTAASTLAEADDHTRVAAELAGRLLRRTDLTGRQIHRLKHELADHHLAVARLTSAAAYRGVPLFHGQYRLRVAGGKLHLPDLVRSAPTQHALANLRDQVHDFQHRVVADRLHVVQATLQRTAQTRAMLLPTSTAVSPATLRGYPALAVGHLLDIRA